MMILARFFGWYTIFRYNKRKECIEASTTLVRSKRSSALYDQ